MFKFMIKFLKILGIACAIGILIRVGEVLIIKHNEKNVEETQEVAEIIKDNIVEQVSENIDVVIENEEKKQVEKVDVKENEEAEQNDVPKTTKNTKTEQKEEIKVEIASNKQEQIVEEKQEITNTQSLPATNEQEILEEQEKIQQDENYTEVEINIAEKKECNGNNHGIDVGNSGKWFNTKEEAIATYKEEIKKWGDKWTDINNPISDEEYYKNCPTRL